MEKEINNSRNRFFESFWACYVKKKKMHGKYRIWGNERTLPEAWVFFTTIGIKTPKCMQSFIWANETKFPETDLLSVYKCVRHQNAKKKKHGNRLIWVYKTALRKTCLWIVFELFTYRNTKPREYNSILLKGTLPKTCILSVFHS